MKKLLEALEDITRCAIWHFEATSPKDGGRDMFIKDIKYKNRIIRKAIKELAVYKLAYEWKCNGLEGSYTEVLEQARKTIANWEKINKRGYGLIVEENSNE